MHNPLWRTCLEKPSGGKLAKDENLLRGANSAQHDINVQPPILLTHLAVGSQHQHGGIHRYALRGLDCTHLPRSQAELKTSHSDSFRLLLATVLKLSTILPTSWGRPDEHHPFTMALIHAEVVHLHIDGTRDILQTGKASLASRMLRVPSPIVHRMFELTMVELDANDFSHGILHDLVLSRNLDDETYAHTII